MLNITYVVKIINWHLATKMIWRKFLHTHALGPITGESKFRVGFVCLEKALQTILMHTPLVKNDWFLGSLDVLILTGCDWVVTAVICYLRNFLLAKSPNVV